MTKTTNDEAECGSIDCGDPEACTLEDCLCCDTMHPESDADCHLCGGDEVVPACRQDEWMETAGPRALGMFYGRAVSRRANRVAS